MFYLWIFLGLFAAVIIVPVMIGLLLPERYVGQVKVVFHKPLDDVWAALSDFERHPMVGKMRKGIEKLPDENGLAVWVEEMGREKITVITVECEQPTRVVREMSSASTLMTSRWEYDLKPVDVGCQVTLDAETYVRSGNWIAPIFRFMMVVGGGVRKGLQIQMDMVASSLGVQAEYER
jgi:hypothetical protein